MGTSKSNPGSPSDSPLIPSWVPTFSDPSNAQSQGGQLPLVKPLQLPSSPPRSKLAPKGRFSGARRNIGIFAKSGDSNYLKKGICQYVKTGLGGRRTAARRMAATAHTARALNAALFVLSSNQEISTKHPLHQATLRGQSAKNIISYIVEAIRPIDGTQDAEASRASVSQALSEVLNIFPEADLQKLSDEQCDFVIERYVIGDVFRRIELDMSASIRSKARYVSTVARRLEEMRDYVCSAVESAFEKVKSDNRDITRLEILEIVRKVLEETMRIFESYT